MEIDLSKVKFRPRTKEQIKYDEQYHVQITPSILEFQARFKTSNPPTDKECDDFLQETVQKGRDLKKSFPYSLNT